MVLILFCNNETDLIHEEGEGHEDGDLQRDLLPRVRGEVEAEDGHAGDQHAGPDQVGEVVQGPTTQRDPDRDILPNPLYISTSRPRNRSGDTRGKLRVTMCQCSW